MDPGDIHRLRTALRDLVALSTIPAAWVGREPSAVAAGLADVLVGSLHLDFAFVRLCDPNGGAAVDVTRGDAWKAFPQWLHRHLAAIGHASRKEVVPDVGGGLEPCRGLVMPIGVNADGGLVAVACDRSDFPSETDQLLLSVLEIRITRKDGSEFDAALACAPFTDERGGPAGFVANIEDISDRKRAEEALRRSEAYLAEAQRLSHTGSWARDIVTNQYTHSSDEYARLFGFDPQRDRPSRAEFLQRIHPGDRERHAEIIDKAARERMDYEVDYRVVLPDGTVRWIHAVGHPVFSACGDFVQLVGTAMDVTERRRAEEEHQAHLWFLESMDWVNRAMQGTNDLEQMMSDVLDVVLSVFNCDRSWLVHPCDPDAASWNVPMEHTRPEFPGVFALGGDLPVDPEIAQVFQTVRASSSPVRFGQASDHPLPAETATRFGIQSMMGMAIHPKGDQPYMLGLHQCSYPRAWTPQEERLFQEIGRRLEDALTSLLMFRGRGESERRLEEAQRISHVGYWERDLATNRYTWSDENYRIFGLRPQERSLSFDDVQALL